jgi:CubicO group peptidase (beta-lactamase class C family)
MLDYGELERLITDKMREAIVPGLALAIVQGDEVIYARGFGVTSTDDNAPPVMPDTLFRIGSVTKPLTGTMIMRLVEMGILDLDKPITEYVNWLIVGDPNVAPQLTLRMLLSHTAGLPTALDYVGWRGPSGLEAYVRTVLPRLKLVAPPGLVYSYSNPGINLAGYVAEAATGKPYTTLMRELVFEPLDMRRTTFDPLEAMTYPLSQSFVLDKQGQPVVKRPFIDNSGEYPCGFAISSVMDLANFAIMHLNEGRFSDKQVLQPETVDTMHRPHANLYTLDERWYGLSMRTRQYKGLRLVGHNGAIAKYGAVLSLVPEHGLGVVMLFNRGPQFWGAADEIVNYIADELLDRKYEPLPPETWEKKVPYVKGHAGAYLGVSAGLVLLECVNDSLILLWNDVRIPLAPLLDNFFFGKQMNGNYVSVGFVDSKSDQPDYLMIDGMLCSRIDYVPYTPDFMKWVMNPVANRTGVYSGDTDVWTIDFKDGALWIYSDDERRGASCIFLDETRFACDFGLFEFELNENGEAVALIGGGGNWRFARVADA